MPNSIFNSMLSILRKLTLAGIALCIAGVWNAAHAQESDAAANVAELAKVCIACHGANGNEPIADNPKLAGQSRKYLLYTMRAYKDGSRKDPVMNAQLAEYSDADLQALAAYFAKQSGDLLY